MTVARILLAFGLVIGLPSLWETLRFSWDPTFQAPALRYGASLTNYHAFREFTLTLGVVAVLCWGMAQPEAGRTPALWWTMALAAMFYYGGWWLPWPLLGLRTPNRLAEAVHVLAALCTVAAVLLAWPSFHPARV